MAMFDMPLAQLQQYRPERDEPADFDAFWAATLAEARGFPLGAQLTPIDIGLAAQESFDLTFAGFGGHPIKGWLHLPRQRGGPVGCVVEYIGYGGGRAMPTDWLLWSSAGYAHLIMDTRGQGSGWSQGDTPDPYPHGVQHAPGFLTKGVRDPQHYYYRRVFTDAVRAIEAARSHPAIDPQRIAVTGGSQGGGIALAAASLEPTVKLAMPDVPFLCHYRRATELIDTAPYSEITRYCAAHRGAVEEVFRTLSYFDGVNLAPRAAAGALFSVGLMDTICPPSTVYAAYNHYAGPRDIRIYHYNNHEGGGGAHAMEKLRFVRERL